MADDRERNQGMRRGNMGQQSGSMDEPSRQGLGRNPRPDDAMETGRQKRDDRQHQQSGGRREEEDDDTER